MDILFVENYCSTIKQNLKDSLVIALTPEACSKLDKEKIPYKILEDYFIWRQDEKYWDWFKDWLDIFEFHHFKGTNIAHDCVAPLQSIMNNYIGKALAYKKVFEAVKPKNIVYYTGQQGLSKIIPHEGTFLGKNRYILNLCQLQNKL